MAKRGDLAGKPINLNRGFDFQSPEPVQEPNQLKAPGAHRCHVCGAFAPFVRGSLLRKQKIVFSCGKHKD